MKAICLGALLTVGVLSTATTVSAGKPRPSVSFFNKNGGARDINRCMPPFTKCVNRVYSQRADIKSSVDCTKSKKCKNDQVRSMVIYGPAKAGLKVKVYDHAKGHRSLDWAEITLRQDLTNMDFVVIGTLEWSHGNRRYHVKHHGKKGLDGKVSRIRIIPAKK